MTYNVFSGTLNPAHFHFCVVTYSHIRPSCILCLGTYHPVSSDGSSCDSSYVYAQQCVTHVVDCLLSHSPSYPVTAAKCLLIGQHAQLYERAVDILKQADDTVRLLSILSFVM